MVSKVVAALFMAVAVVAQDAGPKINTPASVVQCQPAQIQWSGGKPPYWVTVIPAGQVSATPLKTLVSDSQDTSYTWNVDIAANTQVSLAVRDGTGVSQYSSPITIQAGSSTDCMNAGASGSQSAAGSDSAASTGQQTGGAANSTGAAAQSTSSGSATGQSSSSGSATGSSSGSAASQSSSSGSPTGGSSTSASKSGAGASQSSAAATGGSPSSGAMANTVPVIGAAAVAAAVFAAV